MRSTHTRVYTVKSKSRLGNIHKETLAIYNFETTMFIYKAFCLERVYLPTFFCTTFTQRELDPRCIAVDQLIGLNKSLSLTLIYIILNATRQVKI